MNKALRVKKREKLLDVLEILYLIFWVVRWEGFDSFLYVELIIEGVDDL